MRGDNKAARYVTVAAYEKAGGSVRRDLFEDNAYLDDPEKVRSMALAKMQRSKLAKSVAAEGWGWVDYVISLDHSERKQFGEIQLAHQEPSKAQAKQIAALTKKKDEAQAKLAELRSVEGCDPGQLQALRAKIDSRQGELVEIRSALYDYPANLKPLAGAILHLDYSGDLTVTCGLIRQQDREAVAALVRSAAKETGGEGVRVDMPPVKTRPVHSEALTNRLQAQRVIALQAELIQRPNLALCLLIEQMLVEVGDAMEQAYLVRSFDLSATSAAHDLAHIDPDMEESPAWKVRHKEVQALLDGVPAERDALLPWLLAQLQVDLVALLGALVSQTIFRKRSHSYGEETTHLDRLAALVDLNMGKWWSPTVQGYLGHVSKDRIAAVVTEVVGEAQAKPLLAMKKGDAAAAAEQLLEGKGWVPELMRIRPVEAEPRVTDDDQGEE